METEAMYDLLAASPLFSGIDRTDFDKLLGCLSARRVNRAKGELLLLAGDAVTAVGLLLQGRVQVVQEDAQGDTAILAELTPPEVFAEVFAFAGLPKSPVTVQAVEDCELLYLNHKKMVASCPSACPFHIQLVENMLRLLAGKTLLLNQKLFILSRRSTREKLLAYFELQRGGEARFTIPFSREDLAQYLCVDRSAMSSELGRMQKEGLIRFHRHQFEILQQMNKR